MQTRFDRERLLKLVQKTVQEKYYDPQFGGRDWSAIVETYRPKVLSADSIMEFENAVAAMLKELGSGTLALLNEKTKLSSRNAISATFRGVETQTDGLRWVFQDVAPGGPAAVAGMRPGDALLAIDGSDFRPPMRPTFTMGDSYRLTISLTASSKVHDFQLRTPQGKHRDNPCAEPENVTASVRDGVGIVKVSLFPGRLGIDFANRISFVLSSQLKGVNRLVVDLRGNPRGGVGGLRLMSYMTPGKQPIGFSLDRALADKGYDRDRLPRFGKIPKSKFEVPLLALRFANKKSVVLETEGLGRQSFHGHIVVIVNEHTTCSAEMVALFAQKHGLAQILGQTTPGRLVSHSGFNIGFGYTLTVPIAAYVSWKGNRLDGHGLEPDLKSDWQYESALAGDDNQLNEALETVTAL